MIFLSGATLLSCDEMSLSCAPTDLSNITEIKLGGTSFDTLFVTNSCNYEIQDIIPDDWDFDTVLFARFDGTTLAGNMNWSLETTSHLLIKRKKKDEYKWITLTSHEVNDYDDFTITGVDKTAGTNDYIYAVVPVMVTGAEGTYATTELSVKVDRIVILDGDEIWESIFTDGDLGIQYVVPNQPVETMYSKYPTIISNSESNYRNITMTIEMMPTTDEEGNCDPDAMMDDKRRTEYNQRFLDFLHNKKIKLVKAIDGRLFLVWVTTPASISMGDTYEIEDISFGATEVGSPTNEEDLYTARLITSDEVFWN